MLNNIGLVVALSVVFVTDLSINWSDPCDVSFAGIVTLGFLYDGFRLWVRRILTISELIWAALDYWRGGGGWTWVCYVPVIIIGFWLAGAPTLGWPWLVGAIGIAFHFLWPGEPNLWVKS